MLSYNDPMTEHLSPKQSRFVEEYLVNFNATQAAIRAGYSEKTAYSIGSENLKKPDIQQAIAARQKQLADKRRWDMERLVEEAETNLELARTGGWRGVSPANGALELIGRVTGILTDKPRDPQVPVITRVVVVLNRGVDAEGRPQVEEEAYQVRRPELDEGLP
jgi:phage terminase small subunit